MTQASATGPASPAPAAGSTPATPATATAPPRPAGHAATGTLPGTAPRPQPENVPALLNRWQVLAVTACLVFGVLAALLQVLAWQAGDRAADNAEQLVRVQDIETSLYRADALASNAFLQGGLEPAEQRAEYDATIDSVLTQVADAADAQPADRAALAALNTEITRYTTAITQARDNNRQAFPVGGAYLLEASQTLRSAATPILDELVSANATRAQDEMGVDHRWWLALLVLAVLAVLWWVNREIAVRFHRRLNRGLVVAGLAFALVGFVTVSYASNQRGTTDDLEAGPFSLARDEATARTAANDAKAEESLRLIRRAATDDREDAWTAAASTVVATTSLTAQWTAYADAHARVIDLDDQGRWEDAVTASTGQRADGTPGPAESSTAAFDDYDAAASATIAEAGAEVADELRSNELTLVLAILTLLAGLLGAAAATWGINQRRKEYA